MAEAALGGRSIIKYAGHRVGLDYTEVCVCVCVCVRKRERERGAGLFCEGRRKW